MCTMIAMQIPVSGCGKGPEGWFDVKQIDISYDHPFEANLEYALNLDFINTAKGPGARLAIELDEASARQLIASIEAVLAQAEAGGFLPQKQQG